MAKKKPLSFTKRIVTDYGRTTGYSHAFKMDQSKADPKLEIKPSPPTHETKPQKLKIENQFVTSESNRWKLYGRNKPIKLKGPEPKEFLSGKHISKVISKPIVELPQGGKKTLLVSGAKKFQYTERHEKQLVRNFRNFEKKYKNAWLAHDYNPKNQTSVYVARVAKKYNLPTMPDRPVEHPDFNPDPSKKEGFKNRAKAIQAGVDQGKILRVSYDYSGKLKVVPPDQGLRNEWRTRLGEIKKEIKIDSSGKGVPKFRSQIFNKISKNTQQYRAINALMDEIRDFPESSKKFQAGVGYLEDYNKDLQSRLGRSSADVTDFLKEVEGKKLPGGAKLRFEIDDIADVEADPRPKRKLVLDKGKPKLVKQADESTFTDRRYIEKFGDAYDEGTVSDNVKDKKKFKPANKTLLTGTKQENIELAQKKIGPDAYGQSSLTQFMMSNEEEPEHREAKRKSLQDVKPIDIEAEPSDKGGGSNIQRHQETYGEKQQNELKKDIENIDKHKSTFQSIRRKNIKLKKQGKPLIQGTSILTRLQDPYQWDRQSKTLEHTSDVDLPKETQAEKDAKVRAKVKEGSYGGRAKHGKAKIRAPLIKPRASGNFIIPSLIGAGLSIEAFTEGTLQAAELQRGRAKERSMNKTMGGGKRLERFNLLKEPLSNIRRKSYRKVA